MTAAETTPEQAFATALAEFQAAMPDVEKKSTGQAGNQKTKYANLADIADAAYPVLGKLGFSFTASPTLTEAGFVLRYALIHSAGHRETGDYPLPQSANSQQIGSAITYARRYSLLAVTGIAPKDDDDDGARASEVTTDSLPRAPRRRNATTRMTADDMGDPTTRPDEFTEPHRTTDADWIKDFRTRLLLADTPSVLRGLQEEANVQWAEHKLSREDAAQLKAEVAQRDAELRGVPA